MVDAWGGAWASVWGASWGSGAAPALVGRAYKWPDREAQRAKRARENNYLRRTYRPDEDNATTALEPEQPKPPPSPLAPAGIVSGRAIPALPLAKPQARKPPRIKRDVLARKRALAREAARRRREEDEEEEAIILSVLRLL